MSQEKQPIKVIIVGAGQRSMGYAKHALNHPDELKIVAVVDPDRIRLQRAAETHSIPDDNCFATVEELIKQPKMADAVINGTMDDLHVKTTIPLLHAGYDVLLEKPIGTSQEEVTQLENEARKLNRRVMICHVLRYVPFYVEIRRRVEAGEIGDLMHIQTTEYVKYHHMATSFVRGKWANSENSKSTFLMQKSCHDLDLLTWMKSGIKPKKVSSFGSTSLFRADKAPIGAGQRCLVDCQIESSCPYSAGKQYIEHKLWPVYVWSGIEHLGAEPTLEQKLDYLRTDSPFGRCVWHSDNDILDHQSVIIEFADGSTATHSLAGGLAKGGRSIHLIGTLGEIEGNLDESFFMLRRPDLDAKERYQEEKVELIQSRKSHYGGDQGIMEDFLKVLQGEPLSISSTTLEDSIQGHKIGFAADRSVIDNCVIEL